MTAWLATMPTFLLAMTPTQWREHQLRSMRMRFQETDPYVYYRVAVAVLAIAAIFVLVKLMAYWQDRRFEAGRSQPFALFRRVQTKLGLSFFERWTLWRLAKTLKVEHPSALLISPVLYDRAVSEYTKRGPGDGRGRLAAIRTHLFGRAAAQITAPIAPPPPSDPE